ncbi:hypothetical protein CDL12_08752 [Handroanthus impetiginosus]|uniref:RNase H type-1 domain-containing protein n=1 Tax=Handroanthus impetiginosus TaxID=429701 RepID=A0A2G9HMA3_9LAMI|nr:hypothetical protein CDL12_08752 [Handroanthus impetiginosus]
MTVILAWEKPENGWTKSNYDGSCKCKTGKSRIGGIFRNHNAEFFLQHAESIGQSNSTIAELTALLRGLEIMLDSGWSDICLERDSKSLIDIIARGRPAKCTQGNRTADKFAELGHRLKKPQIWRHVPPNEVLHIVNENAQGKTILFEEDKPFVHNL